MYSFVCLCGQPEANFPIKEQQRLGRKTSGASGIGVEEDRSVSEEEVHTETATESEWDQDMDDFHAELYEEMRCIQVRYILCTEKASVS